LGSLSAAGVVKVIEKTPFGYLLLFTKLFGDILNSGNSCFLKRSPEDLSSVAENMDGEMPISPLHALILVLFA